MSWLLFMDESGHDHRTMPYEVRGGFAIHSGKLWSFVKDWLNLELSYFGTHLKQFNKELKGCKLLDKDRLKWATMDLPLEDDERRSLCRKFLTKGLEKLRPTNKEFLAYGQASVGMAGSIMELLREHECYLFASAIPKNVCKPTDFEYEDYLRKDHVFLFERFYFFLKERKEHGIIVMDEVEESEDRKFINRLHNYFLKTSVGKQRSGSIVPVPLFVSSSLSYPVQAADVCIYLINQCFRLPTQGMNAPVRQDLKDFSGWLYDLQFKGEAEKNGSNIFMYGITYVPDPYTSRTR
ncbi:MAG: DUF3800 domain-containing protein [Deferribacterales bacterium]